MRPSVSTLYPYLRSNTCTTLHLPKSRPFSAPDLCPSLTFPASTNPSSRTVPKCFEIIRFGSGLSKLRAWATADLGRPAFRDEGRDMPLLLKGPTRRLWANEATALPCSRQQRSERKDTRDTIVDHAKRPPNLRRSEIVW